MIYLLVIDGWSQYKLGDTEAASFSLVKQGMFISYLQHWQLWFAYCAWSLKDRNEITGQEDRSSIQIYAWVVTQVSCQTRYLHQSW